MDTLDRLINDSAAAGCLIQPMARAPLEDFA